MQFEEVSQALDRFCTIVYQFVALMAVHYASQAFQSAFSQIPQAEDPKCCPDGQKALPQGSVTQLLHAVALIRNWLTVDPDAWPGNGSGNSCLVEA